MEKNPNKEEKSIPQSQTPQIIKRMRDEFRSLLNTLYIESRILSTALIRLERTFLEFTSKTSKIEFLSPEDFFDKQTSNLKSEFKKFTKKYIEENLVKNLSKSLEDKTAPKTFKKKSEEIIKEIRKKYKNMLKDFFIEKEHLEKDIYEQRLQILGESEKLGILAQASYLSSINPSIKEDISVFSEKDEDLIKMKKQLEKMDNLSEEDEDDELKGFLDRSELPKGEKGNRTVIRVNPSKTEDNFFKKNENEKPNEDMNKSLDDETISGNYYGDMESSELGQSMRNQSESEHHREDLDLKGLPKAIDVKRKNMKVEKYESGIEAGNLFF